MKHTIIGIVVVWMIVTMIICSVVKSRFTEQKRTRYEIACNKLKKLMTLSVIVLLLFSFIIGSWAPDFVIFLILVFASLITTSAVAVISEIEHAMRKTS